MISRLPHPHSVFRIQFRLPGSSVRQALAVISITKRHHAIRPFQTSASPNSGLQQEQAIPNTSDIPFDQITNIPRYNLSGLITAARTSSDGESLAIEFQDATFTFHAQWLHDAQVGDGSAKEAAQVYLHKPFPAQIVDTSVSGHGARTTLDVTWNDGHISQFPATWLRVYAPLVGKRHGLDTAKNLNTPKGWLVNTLNIPEIAYGDIFPKIATSGMSHSITDQIYHNLLDESGTGIIKVVKLPAPIVENEREGKNALVTQILTQIFGSVFVHPRRGSDLTFNIASHHKEDVKKGILLPNYNTRKILLPHVDQSFYAHPTRILGLYNLEGESENTFVSCPAALATMLEEAPHLVEHLRTAPMAVGRVAHWYKPSLYQATVDPVITMKPGFPDQIKRFRWNPHLTGSLLTPYDKFHAARAAHRKFQEIMRRDTHELKIFFKPGDLYIIDQFRVLHGRERVLKEPRTSIGQSVPEQVVLDTYREFKLSKLMKHMDEKWLIQMPQPQLQQLENLVDAWDLNGNGESQL